LLGIESQLRNVLYKQVTNNGAVSSLSDIGVSFQRDGTLAVNSTKLNTALTNSAQNVGALFATMGVASDSLVTYAGSTSATLPGNYGLQLTEVATHAAVEGSVTPTSTITSGSNDTLALWIDGSVVNVTLAAGNSYTPATLATEIQQEVNKVLAGTGKSVSVTNDTTGKLRITSSAWGSTSQVQLQGGTAYSSVFGAPDAHGRVIGSQAANTTITSGLNDALSLNVDGTSVSVKLDAGSYSAAGLAGVLQASINSALGSGPQVTVTQSSGVLTIASASTGSGSFVAINDGSGWAGLLGSPDTIAAQGRDVAGTLGGAFASSSGQTLTGTSDASGLAVLVAGGVPGPRGTITFNRGVTATLTSTIDSLLSSTGTIAGRTDGINSLIKDIGNQRTQLNARLVDIEARYRKQFNSLDSLIASMQQTSTYLTQQFASLSSTNTTK
jgi:flagellar hook-associated protein 2